MSARRRDRTPEQDVARVKRRVRLRTKAQRTADRSRRRKRRARKNGWLVKFRRKDSLGMHARLLDGTFDRRYFYVCTAGN